MTAFLLFVIGAGASTFGAIAGVGGGFIVVPILRVVGMQHEVASSASLIMVFANAASASYSFWRQGRIEVRTALLFAATGVPCSIAGSFFVRAASAGTFDLLLGLLLLGIIIDTFRRQGRTAPIPQRTAGTNTGRMVDAYGNEYVYVRNDAAILAAGVVVGLSSTFFGVGGGFLMVPFMLWILRLPPHIATATSSFAITLMTPVGIATNFALDLSAGRVAAVLHAGLFLAAGALVGGQLGARLAPRLSSRMITTVLGLMMIVAELLLIARHWPLVR